MSDNLKLISLLDSGSLRQKLIEVGLSEKGVDEKAGLFQKSAGVLQGMGIEKNAGVIAFYIPGRIEVLGRHTDYGGGRTVIAAAEKGFCFVASAREDKTIRITDARCNETVRFEIDPELSPPLGQWANYPMTVARRVARNFTGALKGCDVAFASDLPIAAGMSSSSAMMVGNFLVLSRINQLDQEPVYQANINSKESLAGYLGTVENGQSFGTLTGDKGVGTFGGSEDHTAMLCCKANNLSQYSYCPVRFERLLPLPQDYIFVIAGSGVVAEKTGAAREKYNRASRLVSKAMEIWQKETGGQEPTLAAITGESSQKITQFQEVLRQYKGTDFTAQDVLDRFEHFYLENEEIVPGAGAALLKGDMTTFGREVDRSQEIADTLLKNQVPETIFLARSARELGAQAASTFGAGFGGSVWALMPVRQAESFQEKWRKKYQEEYPQTAAQAVFFRTRPGPAVFTL